MTTRDTGAWRRSALAVMMVAAAVPAVTSPAVGQGAAGRDVVTLDEIHARARGARTAEDVVRRLRPTWLRPGGTLTRGFAEGGEEGCITCGEFNPRASIILYIDNVRRGVAPGDLVGVPIEQVQEIRYFRPIEATSRWGTGHTAGAIEVITSTFNAAVLPRNDSTATGEPGGSDVVIVEDVTGRPPPEYEPPPPPIIFPARVVAFMNSGAAMFSSPQEKQEIWSPGYSVGAGIGVKTSRSVTFFATAELHSFTFTERGTLEYLLAQEQGRRRLKSVDGIVVQSGDNRVLNFSANAKWRPGQGRFSPYFLIGVGYARLETPTVLITGEVGDSIPRTQFPPGRLEGGNQVENAVTWGFGGGLEFSVTRLWHLFADVRFVEAIRGPRYNDVFDENQLFNTQFLPLRIGLLFR